MNSKRWIVKSIGVAAFFAGAAQAQQASTPAPIHSVTYNVSVVSDYRFRGLSQTRREGALQGGADYTHNPSGGYAGIWVSNVKWTKDGGGGGNFEWDVYGGKKGNLTEALSYDVGLYAYVYPRNSLRPNANTYEVYGQLGYGPWYVKYSRTLSNSFAFADSKGSYYLDGGANFGLGAGFTLNAHIGRQVVRHNNNADYTDYKLGVTKEFSLGSIALAGYKADTKDAAYLGRDRDLSKIGLVLSFYKTF